MSLQEAADRIVKAVCVTREVISRAKGFVLETAESETDTLAQLWLKAQDALASRELHLDSAAVDDEIALFAKSCSLRMALYQAVWELVTSAELLLAGETLMWTAQATGRTSHGAGGLPLDRLECPYPKSVRRAPLPNQPPQDVDVFLKDLDVGLHPGVREAIKQSLACFHRGLYLPSLAMLGAGVEAAWIECGFAVAAKLADTKLQSNLADQFISLSKKVTETRKSLDTAQAKALLKTAGVTKSRLDDAEIWTTVLRERRNALHWGKAKSFVADHGDAAGLLLGVPMHLGTLEAIRNAC